MVEVLLLLLLLLVCVWIKVDAEASTPPWQQTTAKKTTTRPAVDFIL